MPIKPSANAEVRQLVDALAGADDVAREAAVARLTVVGPRAIEYLMHEFPSASVPTRVGMLRVFEAVEDPRALPLSRVSLDDSSHAVQSAAVAAIRSLLASDAPNVARDALDALLAIAIDRHRDPDVRAAAIDALRDAPADVRSALDATLAADADLAQRARAARPAQRPQTNWSDVVGGTLPASPTALKRLVASVRTTARLTELQRVVDHLRVHEQRETDAHAREEWRAVRGALHQALASRNSRLALYDLRDSLLGADRLPVTFLAALEEIGDATCLEPLAAAYDASSRSSDTWWREHVATAFRAIVQREGLTRRHAAMKRVVARWPDAAADLMARL
jgi:hypothetical protein